MKLSVLAATLLLTLATPAFSVPIEQAAESSSDGTPTTTATAAPKASSSSSPGDGGDSDLAAWIEEETAFAQKSMFANFNPEGSVPGFIAASPSKDQPDYFYAWTRDSSLTMRSALHVYNTSPSEEVAGYLEDFVTFQVNAMGQKTECDCLGEPKFNADGSSFTGPWGRPQNDGPAERATAMILVAEALGDNSTIGEEIKTAVKKDLDYIVETWQTPCFDLWEEISSVSFFTLMVMRKGLTDGAKFLGDDSYTSTASEIEAKLKTFVGDKGYIEASQDRDGGLDYKTSGLDTSTLIAANVASLGDGFYTPGSDAILATSLAIKESMADLYAINADSESEGVSYAIGRYPEDKYDGIGNSIANPWFLCTLAFAETYYRAIEEWKSAGSIEVTATSAAFFKQFDSAAAEGTTYKADSEEFDAVVKGVAAEADTYFKRVQKHATNNEMSEQFNKDTGEETGAKNLTWSYSAFITAAAAYSGKPAA
ncbi:glucoamylase [Circinella umbellata]|nr:glucoamylase [Circinella umbellata]